MCCWFGIVCQWLEPIERIQLSWLNLCCWPFNHHGHFNCLKLIAAVCIICGARCNDHTEPFFKLLDILPLDYLCQFFDLQFMQQFLKVFYLILSQTVGSQMHFAEMKISTLYLETMRNLLPPLLEFHLLRDCLSPGPKNLDQI